MENKIVYVYSRDELADAIYEASNYAIKTEIKFKTSGFSVLLDGSILDNKTATKISNQIRKSSLKLWKAL